MHDKTLQARIVALARPFQSWFSSYARRRFFSSLKTGLLVGELIIDDDMGRHCFGSANGRAPVIVTVKNNDLWVRLALSLDMGFAEAYMEQDFDVSDLKGLMDIWLDNRKTLDSMTTVLSLLSGYASALAIKFLGRQTLIMSKRNVEEAYDTSNDFFQSFLSEEMMYSCALWSDAEHGVRGDLIYGTSEGDLETAQSRKIASLLKKARLRPGDRLLEIGSGWGALAIEAAKMGYFVDSVTLSKEQKAMADSRIRDAGLEQFATIHLCDYRELPASFKGVFDGFVSCEMIEHVGRNHHVEYFRTVDWALKPDRGAAVITATSQPDFRYSDFQTDCFARHYHWPNVFLPSATALPTWVQHAVPGRLVLENMENRTAHYPRTLREWRRRFEKNFDGKIISDLQIQHPTLQDKSILEAFRRKWLCMFQYAEAGFAREYTSVNEWTFVRPENPVEQS